MSYRYPHLSLVVLETFFENDAVNAVSVKPIVQRYADAVGIITDPETLKLIPQIADNFREQTITELLETITKFDAAKREAIFNQKQLHSLTVLLELLIKSGIETTTDAEKFAEDDGKIAEIRAKLEAKGYIGKFTDAIMHDVFGKDTDMKRKKTDDQLGVNSPMRSVKAEIIQTRTRKIQVFPALQGAWLWGVGTVSGLITAVFLAILGIGFFVTNSSDTALTCINTDSQYKQAGQIVPNNIAAICNSNANYSAIGIVLIIFAALALAVGIVFCVRFVKILAHNQFASTHNAFELTHYELTK